MTITRIKNIKEVENKEPTSGSAFLHRAGSTDYYATMEQMENYLAVKTDAKIANEATARQEADTTLQANIDKEASTRLANDNTLQTNINTEISDRKAAVSAEETARKEADTDLQTQITANESAISTLNGTGEDSVTKTVADKIADVVSGAPESLDTLKEISDWISGHEDDAAAMNSAISANTTAVEKEAASRASGDNALQTKIEAEAERAANAETALTASLNDETARAKAKEDELEESIASNSAAVSDEATRATDKETELQSNIDAEAKAREEADTAIQERIDTLNGDAETEGSVAKAVADAKADTEATITDTVNGIVNTQVSKVVDERSSKSGVDTHKITVLFGAANSTVYLHVLTTKGADAQNGIIELYIGGNGDSVVDSFKFTISSSGGNTTLKQLLRADFAKHAAGVGIVAAYACTTSYSADKQIWLEIKNAKNNLAYYAMANSFLTAPTWVMKTQTSKPANITTTLDLSNMMCGSKTA